MPASFRNTSFRPRLALHTSPQCLLLLAFLLTASGCVHRRMIVNSSPPGATVFVDGEKIGVTPTGMDFTYYATRQVKLVKDGYQPLTVLQKVPTPWYQYIPLDFISDNFLPFKVKNRHEFTYQLQPQIIPTADELKRRANELRAEARMGP